MRLLFVLEIREFLDSCSLKYDFKGNRFYLPDSSLLILPVPLIGDDCLDKENESNQANNINGLRQIKIYEDLWFTKGDIIRNRLRALLGKGEVIFARKCRVAKIGAKMASGFLESNHILGYSKSKYFYGLFYSERLNSLPSDISNEASLAKYNTLGNDLEKEKLVAVAAFSASRPMKRDNVAVDSFEWVRYASVGSSRVIGGMGRLFNMFVEQQSPQEVMSYADLDWGGGDAYNGVGNAYKKLGFELIGKTAPVKFMVDPKTYQRYSLKKLLRDRRYNKNYTQSNQEHNIPNDKNLNDKNLNDKVINDKDLNEKEFILLLNSGNFKFLRSFSFL